VIDRTIRSSIERLKDARNAVILAHNYQPPEVQEIADIVGDSLELSRRAASTAAETIVFCGVRFMAETAAILSPDRAVLLPDEYAGCPMAEMITAEALRTLRREHPRAMVVCYVNSTAEVKAESDICCTSANAVQVVRSLADVAEIIFVPDRHLGDHVSRQVGRELILWPGYCPTHARIRKADIDRARARYGEVCVMVHPECQRDVRDAADEVLSTGQMCRYARQSSLRRFVVGTEPGLLHRLALENPRKHFYPANPQATCPNMKRTSLEKILWSLQDMAPRIAAPRQVGDRARKALDAMLAVTESCSPT